MLGALPRALAHRAILFLAQHVIATRGWLHQLYFSTAQKPMESEESWVRREYNAPSTEYTFPSPLPLLRDLLKRDRISGQRISCRFDATCALVIRSHVLFLRSGRGWFNRERNRVISWHFDIPPGDAIFLLASST